MRKEHSRKVAAMVRSNLMPQAYSPKWGGPSRGFTLIEVLVALVVLSLALAVIFSGVSEALRSRRAALHYQQAMLLAESKLASIGLETPLQEGEFSGDFSDQFHWRALVTPYHEEGREEPDQAPVRALVVTVTVLWGPAGDERSVSLSTLRLAARG
jgi:general secretion pathway protein I